MIIIIAQLYCRIGTQMFQYAASIDLSAPENVPLRFET
ncbi:putative fucosyl transferase [Thermosynechococcus sp. NK55a]|nr:putative fucosyl transferase [Thermosynechococcus sp. NK55a]